MYCHVLFGIFSFSNAPCFVLLSPAVFQKVSSWFLVAMIRFSFLARSWLSFTAAQTDVTEPVRYVMPHNIDLYRCWCLAVTPQLVSSSKQYRPRSQVFPTAFCSTYTDHFVQPFELFYDVVAALAFLRLNASSQPRSSLVV